MHIEFMAAGQGRPTSRKTIITSACLLVLTLALIAYSKHLMLSLAVPIVFIGYRLFFAVKTKNAVRDIRMTFDFEPEYLLWTEEDTGHVTQKKLTYDNISIVISGDRRCELSHVSDKTRVFYGPEDKLKLLKEEMERRKALYENKIYH